MKIPHDTAFHRRHHGYDSGVCPVCWRRAGWVTVAFFVAALLVILSQHLYPSR